MAWGRWGLSQARWGQSPSSCAAKARKKRSALAATAQAEPCPVPPRKKRFNVTDQIAATQGVECRKDADVIDEIPMAYKDIDAVMAAQADLVEIVHTLKQVVCVKG